MSTKPRVWSNFTVKTKNGDLKLRIQDAPSDRKEDVANFFTKYFATEETFHKAAGVGSNKEALEESKELVTSSEMANSVVICCEDDGTDTVGELIAASLMMLEKKDEEDDFDFKPKTKEVARMFEMMEVVFEKYNAIKELGVDTLYEDRGVVVHPEYRGLGLAQKMFHIRRIICKEEGVPLTGAWMTSFGSQKAAEHDGWQTVCEVPYKELEEKFGITFVDVPPSTKYMIAKAL